MGCFLVLLVISGTHANHLAYLGTASSTDWPTTVAGNQSYAAYIAAGFHSEQNALKSDRMELSLGTPAPAILPVEPSQITNSLIR